MDCDLDGALAGVRYQMLLTVNDVFRAFRPRHENHVPLLDIELMRTLVDVEDVLLLAGKTAAVHAILQHVEWANSQRDDRGGSRQQFLSGGDGPERLSGSELVLVRSVHRHLVA